MQHQISNYTFTIFDKFQYENRTEKRSFPVKMQDKKVFDLIIYIFLNKVFSQVSEHTHIVLQESKGKKTTSRYARPPFPRRITVIKKLSVTFAYDYKKPLRSTS